MNVQERRSIRPIVLLAVAMLVATCGADPTVEGQTPLGATYGYFQALNEGNWLAANGFLAPGSMLPADDSAAPFDEFENVRCRPASDLNPELVDTDNVAFVYCEFDVGEFWSGFSPGHYGWGIELHRQPPGPWLVYDWGQG